MKRDEYREIQIGNLTIRNQLIRSYIREADTISQGEIQLPDLIADFQHKGCIEYPLPGEIQCRFNPDAGI